MKKNNIKIDDGDMFQLGRHRLICGDSTQKNTYTRLLQSAKIDLILTDPPYNVDVSTKQKRINKLYGGNRNEKPIENDINIDETFFRRVYKNWKNILNSYNSIYIYSVEIIPLNV